jgi:hypothetical protein
MVFLLFYVVWAASPIAALAAGWSNAVPQSCLATPQLSLCRNGKRRRHRERVRAPVFPFPVTYGLGPVRKYGGRSQIWVRLSSGKSSRAKTWRGGEERLIL